MRERKTDGGRATDVHARMETADSGRWRFKRQKSDGDSERKKGTGRSEIGKRGDRQTAPNSIIADDDDSKCGPGLSPTRTDVSVG